MIVIYLRLYNTHYKAQASVYTSPAALSSIFKGIKLFGVMSGIETKKRGAYTVKGQSKLANKEIRVRQ